MSNLCLQKCTSGSLECLQFQYTAIIDINYDNDKTSLQSFAYNTVWQKSLCSYQTRHNPSKCVSGSITFSWHAKVANSTTFTFTKDDVQDKLHKNFPKRIAPGVSTHNKHIDFWRRKVFFLCSTHICKIIQFALKNQFNYIRLYDVVFMLYVFLLKILTCTSVATSL